MLSNNSSLGSSNNLFINISISISYGYLEAEDWEIFGVFIYKFIGVWFLSSLTIV